MKYVLTIVLAVVASLAIAKEKTIQDLYSEYRNGSNSSNFDSSEVSDEIGKKILKISESCKEKDIDKHIRFIYEMKGSADEGLSFGLVPLLDKCEKQLLKELKTKKDDVVKEFHSRLEWGVENKIYNCTSRECQDLKIKMKKMSSDLKLVSNLDSSKEKK